MLPKLLPFRVELCYIGRYPLYQVANHDGKVRLQRINLADCTIKYVPLIQTATRFITNNRETEFVRIPLRTVVRQLVSGPENLEPVLQHYQ